MNSKSAPSTDSAESLLREAREELRLIRMKDSPACYDPTLRARIDIFLAAPEAGKEHWARDLEVNTSASTVARQPAAGSVMAALEEPTMPMLPNQYHPGPRCSCRECLVTFPLSKFTAAPQECAPVMGAVGNSSSPPCETDVKPAVAAPEAVKEPSEAEIALFDYLENRPSTDCEWTKGYNEAKRRTLVLLKAAGVERDMSGFTCKGCGHIRGLTNHCLKCGLPDPAPLCHDCPARNPDRIQQVLPEEKP